MIGALIGGALSLGSSIVGGYLSSEAAEEAYEAQQKNIERQQKEWQNWYDRRYNEDPTQRADAQRLLTLTSEKLRQRNRAAEGKAAVMGASEEAVANEKQANAQAMADVASQIAAAGEARKDAIEDRYMERKSNLDNAAANAKTAYEQGKANAIAGAVKGVGAAAGSFATGIDGAKGTETTETTQPTQPTVYGYTGGTASDVAPKSTPAHFVPQHGLQKYGLPEDELYLNN